MQWLKLPQPVCSQSIHSHVKGRVDISAVSVNGWRTDNEDTHDILISNKTNRILIGVYDGHSGSSTSKRLAKTVLTKLEGLDEITEENAVMIFEEIDRQILDTPGVAQSGSTATVAVVSEGSDPETLNVITLNVGDSRILVARRDSGSYVPEQLTTDHKPSLPSESARLTSAGVDFSRDRIFALSTCLAVSRSFGDIIFKRTPNLPLSCQPVVATPEVCRYTISKDDILILCCDGITDCLKSSEIAALAAKENPPKACADVSASICMAALRAGSTDNLTCVVATFNGAAERAEEVTNLFIPGALELTQPYVGIYEKDANANGYSLGEAMALRYQTHGKQVVSELKHVPTPPADVASERQTLADWFNDMIKRYRDETVFVAAGIPLVDSDGEDSSDDTPPARVKRPIPEPPPAAKVQRRSPS